MQTGTVPSKQFCKQSEMEKLSLVIGVYKNIDYLQLIFKSLEQQNFKGFEVIVAEDDEDPKVADFIEYAKKLQDFPISHVRQPDKGFRKNKIYNQAIRIAKHDFIVFIDGDCILHPRFLEVYALKARENLCLFGRRVRLDPKTSEALVRTENFRYLSLFRLLLNGSKRIEDGLYLPFYTHRKEKNILGCNFCVARKKLIEINGFDEDFVTPLYGEDTDIKRRLKMIGVQFESTRFKAIQYHLYHDIGDRTDIWRISGDLYQKKLEEGLSYARNGLSKDFQYR